MPATRHVKNPALLLPLRPAPNVENTVYLVGRHPIKHGTETLQPGAVVPDAAGWYNLEGCLRVGTLVQQTGEAS